MRNRCGACHYTWHPRGHYFSIKCPRCGSNKVQGVDDTFTWVMGAVCTLLLTCLMIWAMVGGR